MATKRQLIALLVVGVISLSFPAKAQVGKFLFNSGSPQSQSQGWFTLKVGGGGFATGIDLHADGTKLSRTNTGNAYKWNGSVWVPLIDNTLPAATFGYPQDIGVMEIVAAPSATSTCYMHYAGFMLKSTTGCGVGTWSNLTAWAKDNDLSNASQSQFGAVGPLIAVDPINANIVLAGSNNTGASGGLYLSSNGGNSFAAVPTVAQSSSFINVAFDPSSPQTGGATQGIYGCSNGTGCFHSTNGGGAWTAISSSGLGGPTSCLSIIVDVNGNLWCTDFTIWKYNGSSWSHSYTTNDQGGYYSLAIDPNTAGATTEHVFAVTQYGNINVSLDTGGTWSGPHPNTASPTVTATDIAWLAATLQISMTVGRVMFDPANPTVLYAAAGTGVFTITPPTSNVTTTPIVWNSQTAGQETLVVNVILAPPGGSVQPSEFVWDRSAFRLTNLDAYSNSQTAFLNDAPEAAWGAAWATGTPTTLVATFGHSFASCVDTKSGISTDGGQTWNPFATQPSPLGDCAFHGGIAAGTSTNVIYVQGEAPSNGTPSFSSNGGGSWALITGATIPADGWSGNGYSAAGRVTADQVTLNTIYLANNGTTAPGIYQCTGGSCVRNSTSLPAAGEPGIYSVPGNAGHLFASFGNNGGSYYSINSGASWVGPIANPISGAQFANPSIGFGGVFPGKTYPSVYMIGKDYNNTNSTYSAFRCTGFNTSTGQCVQSTFTGSIVGTVLTVSGTVTGSVLAAGQILSGAGMTVGTQIVSLGT